MSWVDSKADSAIVVMTVVLGLGSVVAVGRKSQYRKMWPGLKRQNRRRERGVGSQTASSQTSRAASGWDLDSALSAASMLERKRSGEDERGEESTRTRCAEGVLGTSSMELSKRR